MELNLHPCPSEGSGVHFWMFGAACYLRRRGLTDGEIFAEIESRSARKNHREISEAVRNSAFTVGAVSSFCRRDNRPGILPKATFDQKAVAVVARRYGGLGMLRGVSPADVSGLPTERLIDALFPGNPLLCLATRISNSRTEHRDFFRGREHLRPLLVPSPMTSRYGANKAGRGSTRCLDNTGPRRFLIVEFDAADLDTQAAALLHLASIGPMVLVCHSGKKSLHGWFFCEGQDEAMLHHFHQYAVRLGADPATWTKCQLVRTPNAIRPDTGKIQEVLFLHPAACPDFQMK